MHPVSVLGAAAGKLPEADLPPLAETWLSFASHHICLYKRGLLTNKQNRVYWESHPRLEAQHTDLSSSWRLKINRYSQERKEKALEGMELVEGLTHKRLLPKSHVVMGRFIFEPKHGALC